MNLHSLFRHTIYPLLIYLAVVFVIYIIYIEISEQWVYIGGANPQLIYFEIPFLLLVSIILYFQKIKNRFVKYILPVVPVLILYLCFDIVYIFLSRSPRLSDAQNINTIFDFSPEFTFLFVLIVLITLISISLLLYHAYRSYSFKNFIVLLFIKLVAIVVIAVVVFSDGFAGYILKAYKYVPWSQQANIRSNGRFMSYLYYSTEERQNFIKLKKFASQGEMSTDNIYKALYPGKPTISPNIHIIILESFIDPRLLNGIKFNKNPLALELKPYLASNSNFNHLVSPTYGGGTAQAEFEILTGVPALAKINSIEYNLMTGSKTISFLNQLKKYNYKTYATIATNKGYFNSVNAYKSLGFDNVVFLEESTDFKKDENDEFIFDGALFEYNINMVKKNISNKNTPFINYVLGMYGHIPYIRNTKKRPDIIDVVNSEDEKLKRIANQFYYRTKALAEYIKKLVSIDKEAIIFVTSDHLPSIIDGDIKYRYDKHINISLLLNGTKPHTIDKKKYYEVPWLIWDIVTGIDHKRNHTDKDLEKMYYRLMYEASRLNN